MRRLITGLKNIYNGDIWVIGAGASMNYVEPSFFDNKIVIGVNEAYKKYRCDYLIRKHLVGLEYTVKYIKKYSPLTKLVVSEYDCGNLGVNLNTLENVKMNNVDESIDYWYFEHLENTMAKDLDTHLIGTDKLINSYSTITSAIHLAFYMGAKNIILCGHDCGILDGKTLFDKYVDNPKPPEREDAYKVWLPQIISQTIALRNELKKKGINLYSLNPFIGLGLEGHKYE